jgi:mannose-6-phosphate isomerase-like protein (cupin superfamily)
MRTTMIGAALLVAGLQWAPARAQTEPSGAKPAVTVNREMLEAAEKIGRAALKPGVSVADTGEYNVAVAFVTRPATKTPSGATLSHDKITEIYYVLRGRGTSVTGTLVNGTPSTGSPTIGPGWRSDSPIPDGRRVSLGPGEIQVIPPGLGHVWSEIDEGGIDYLVIRVDPDRVTAVSK